MLHINALRLAKRTFLLLAVFASSVSAADSAKPEKTQPQPTALQIPSGDIQLKGHRDTAQIIVSGSLPGDKRADFTRTVSLSSSDPAIVKITKTGQLVPVADGSATVRAQLGDKLSTSIKVTVSGMKQPDTVSFRNDVVPAFSQANCNMGACHGTPTGKGGFKLSLRGYLPDQDFTILSREAGGRRIDVFAPDASLVLRKPLGEVAHEGGLRLSRNTMSHQMIRDWIAEGAIDDPAAPKAVKLEIAPENRVIHEPFTTQQVAVRVTYSDNTVRDVTPLAYYNSSAPEIADVDVNGYVTFKSAGEAAIIAHYQDLVAIVRLTHLVEVPGFKPVAV
ncbi:MAG: Ig domain-containing protein, partial [bacterium]